MKLTCMGNQWKGAKKQRGVKLVKRRCFSKPLFLTGVVKGDDINLIWRSLEPISDNSIFDAVSGIVGTYECLVISTFNFPNGILTVHGLSSTPNAAQLNNSLITDLVSSAVLANTEDLCNHTSVTHRVLITNTGNMLDLIDSYKELPVDRDSIINLRRCSADTVLVA